MFKYILKVVLGVFLMLGTLGGTVVGTLALLDGKVFDFPNHRVLVLNQGVHIYKKAETFEFLTEEQMKELAK
jgi:hypothetical protein